MSEPFMIMPASNTVLLTAQRRGQAVFTVSNVSGRALKGRALLTVPDAAATPWLSLDGAAARDFPIAGTQQYTVQIAVPPAVAAGNYTFRLDAVSVENPDEDFSKGPSVAFTVPAPITKGIPWWIPVAVLVVVVLIAGGGIAYIFSPVPAPASTATPIAVINTPVPTVDPTVTPAPTPQPTPIGGGAGRLAYVTNENLNIINADGSKAQILVAGTAYQYRLGWSPDGTAIAFSCSEPGLPTAQICVWYADRTVRSLTPNQSTIEHRNPSWSPDGRLIAFDTGGAIYTMNADGSNLQQLPSSGRDSDPVWSPDGSMIAFLSSRDSSPSVQTSEVYLMAPNGLNQRRVTTTTNLVGGASSLSWSADGKQIAYRTTQGIEVVSLDPITQKPITHSVLIPSTPDAQIDWGSWSPDNTLFALVTESGGTTGYTLAVVNVKDGSKRTTILQNPGIIVAFAWQPATKP